MENKNTPSVIGIAVTCGFCSCDGSFSAFKIPSASEANIINFDFSEAFITAIEEKQVAQQQLLKAETEKQTAITNAEAQAETIKIKAEAEANDNNKIKASLNNDIIRSKFYEKWNGELPQAMGSDSVITSIDGGSGNTKSE